MARLNFLAAIGLFCSLASVVLMIFLQISQISSSQKVPRVIRMTYVDTTNFGPALASSGIDTGSLYGSGQRSGDGTGLRQYYEWGLWANCEGSSLGTTSNAYCTPTGFGHRFQPLTTLLSDAPSDLRTNILNSLPNNVFTDDSFLGRFSRASFYLFFCGAILSGLSLILGLMAHRFAYLLSSLAAFLAFLAIGVAAAIWTAIVYRAKRAINNTSTGLHLSYGNGIWIAWAATLASILSVIPFLLACCFGQSKRKYDYDDEKY